MADDFISEMIYKVSMESQTQYELPIQTNSKGAYLFSAIMGGFWILMVVYIIMKIDLTDPTNIMPEIIICVFGLIVLIPLTIGILKRSVTLIFKVDDQKSALIYESHWGNNLTFIRSYPLNEIKGFEVHKVYTNKIGSKHSLAQNQLLALCFQNRRPKYLTNFLDNENSTEFAQKLNRFLTDNTQIRIDRMRATPYTPESQKPYLRYYYMNVYIIIFVGILTVVFCIIWI